MRYLLHPEADEELAEPVRYDTQIDVELSFRFCREMERLLRAVCAAPQTFHKFDPSARRYVSTQLPYAVVYLGKPNHV